MLRNLAPVAAVATDWISFDDRGSDCTELEKASSDIVQIGAIFVYLTKSSYQSEAGDNDILPTLLVDSQRGVEKTQVIPDAILRLGRLGIHTACCDTEIVLDEARMFNEGCLFDAEIRGILSIDWGRSSPTLHAAMLAATATNGLLVLNNFGALVRGARRLEIDKSDNSTVDFTHLGSATSWLLTELERFSRSRKFGTEAAGVVVICDEPLNRREQDPNLNLEERELFRTSFFSMRRFEEVVTIGVAGKSATPDVSSSILRGTRFNASSSANFASHVVNTIDAEIIIAAAHFERSNIVHLYNGKVGSDIYSISVHKLQATSSEGTSPSFKGNRVPFSRWRNIGGCWAAKRELEKAILWPQECATEFKHLSLRRPRGIILHGPPGNGKTLLARAVADEMEANFLGVRSVELLRPHLGESEAAVRNYFAAARDTEPCVLFFDELDAIGIARGDAARANGSTLCTRLVATLLNELDGVLDQNEGVVNSSAHTY